MHVAKLWAGWALPLDHTHQGVIVGSRLPAI